MRRATYALFLALLLLLPACAADGGAQAGGPTPGLPDDGVPREERLQRLLGALAHDSMMGRGVGTQGTAMAARFLVSELERYGVAPAGEDGYFQPVPLARVEINGRERLVLPQEGLAFDTLPEGSVIPGEVNVIGIIPGTDPALADEVVIIGAHYDHLGIRAAVDGDSIYNGADDDGSGTVAVLEIARELARAPARRTVLVLLTTAEEGGILGARWYLERPVVPLERTVADLQFEMIGRPDSLAGGHGRAWLTGYERTTMGDQLAAAGSPIIPDPRPEMRFFFRSDNTPFAMRGIPAHTISSYDLHTDYHGPDDEVERIDFAHMAAIVDAAVAAVRTLADGPTPTWKEGGREGLPGGP